jgi:hypothetical protein
MSVEPERQSTIRFTNFLAGLCPFARDERAG